MFTEEEIKQWQKTSQVLYSFGTALFSTIDIAFALQCMQFDGIIYFFTDIRQTIKYSMFLAALQFVVIIESNVSIFEVLNPCGANPVYIRDREGVEIGPAS